MEYLLVSVAALFVSGLTLFSGFGLGTLLMPVFALFFPVEVAIAATALVHLGNNVLKTALFGRHADRHVVLWFAVPAILAALAGAALLTRVSLLPPLASYELWGIGAQVTAVKLLVAVLMVAFAVVELHPAFKEFQFRRPHLPVGGLLSGFFGGLSGHQGALRAAFLTRAGLTTPGFIGTAAVASLMVDITRLLVYGTFFYLQHIQAIGRQQATHTWGWSLVLVAMASAFAGVFIGKKLTHKVTMHLVQRLTGALLVLIALALAAGVV